MDETVDTSEDGRYSLCTYPVDQAIVGRVRLHVCEDCGALVHDRDAHDEFHAAVGIGRDGHSNA